MASPTPTRRAVPREDASDRDARLEQPEEGTEPLGESTSVPRGGWRERMRTNPATKQLYRLGVFIAGLLFVLLGIAFVALPGPLTIPPMLVGLWIWSTEFAWADRLFRRMQRQGREAWAHAKQHPVSSAAITIGGLVAAVAAFWAVKHFELIDKAKDAI